MAGVYGLVAESITREAKGKGMKWSGREDSNLRPPGPEPSDDEESKD